MEKAFPFYAPLVKKLTVRGSIGKMQGINSAANPPTKPEIKIPKNVVFSSFSTVGALTSIEAVFKGFLIILSSFFTTESTGGVMSVNSRSPGGTFSCA